MAMKRVSSTSRRNMLQLPQAAVLCYLLLPSLVCDNLRCYFSLLQLKDETVELVPTECPPEELCFKAHGRYGNQSSLTARGCMARKDCSQVHSARVKGNIYRITYSCCERPYCNSCPGVGEETLFVTVTLLTAAVMGVIMWLQTPESGASIRDQVQKMKWADPQHWAMQRIWCGEYALCDHTEANTRGC